MPNETSPQAETEQQLHNIQMVQFQAEGSSQTSEIGFLANAPGSKIVLGGPDATSTYARDFHTGQSVAIITTSEGNIGLGAGVMIDSRTGSKYRLPEGSATVGIGNRLRLPGGAETSEVKSVLLWGRGTFAPIGAPEVQRQLEYPSPFPELKHHLAAAREELYPGDAVENDRIRFWSER